MSESEVMSAVVVMVVVMVVVVVVFAHMSLMPPLVGFAVRLRSGLE